VSARLVEHRRELVLEVAAAYDRGACDMALDVADALDEGADPATVARDLRDFACQMQEHDYS
jgi:hypothetical protein